MFWKFAPSSNIDSLLDKEDLTLRELLNEEEVLQECKGQNTKLIEFLCKKENIEDLVDMITLEPPEDENEAVKYKFPSLACELLTSDVSQINDALGDSEVIRKKLFSFLDREIPVNSLLASFFSKVVGILLSRKPEPTLEYIKSQDDFLASVLKHLGTSAIMDLLLRMVTCVEAADLRAQVVFWLDENQLVQRLIALIDPAYDEELHCNSAQSLCDIIRLSREHMYTMQEAAQEDPLLDTLEREETVSLLLRHMFDGELIESVIVNGISILLALLEIRRPAPFGFPEAVPELTQLDVERLARGVSRTLHAVSGRLGDFHKLLLNPPKKEVMKCTFGDLDPPLGNTRLHVGKLLSAILMTNTHNINSRLADLKMFDALLDLFFKYEYNNFLHTQVAGCIQTVLTNAANVPTPPLATKTDSPTAIPPDGSQESTDSAKQQEEEETESENPRLVAPLLAHIFEECRIIQRIMDAWEDNHRHENDDGGHRKGNMGHLTAITNYIVEGLDKGTNCERLKRFITEMPEENQERWQRFLSETLSDMNEKNSRELGGHNPMHFSSDEENDDFKDVPFNTDSSLQQFGLNDEDFAETEDNMKFDKIETIDFDIKGDTNMSSQLFEAVCKARVAHLDENFDVEPDEDDGSDKSTDDIWQFADDVRGSPDSKTISTTPTVTVRHRSDSSSSTGSSGSNTESSGSNGSPVGSPTINVPIKIPDTEDMDTSQPPGWKVSFNDSFDNSSSSSNESTPTSSPRAVSSMEQKNSKSDSGHPMDVGQESKDGAAVTSSANTDVGWADFDKFNSNPVEVVPSSTTDNQATSQEQSSAFPIADSTSKANTLEDLDAGSPMTVTYQHSPGETSEVTSSQIAAVSSSDEPGQQKPAVQDVDMADVSSPPEVSSVETEVHSPAPPSTEIEPHDDNTPSPSSSSAPSCGDTSSGTNPVEMDTDPSLTDESEVKRQRIETQEQQQKSNSLGAGGDLEVNSSPASAGDVNEDPPRSEEKRESNGKDSEITSSKQDSESILVNHQDLVQVHETAADTGNVTEAVADSLGDNGQVTVVANVTPDVETDVVTDTSASLMKQSALRNLQHNEVSSSSSVEAKVVNAEEGSDSPMEKPPSAITMNGPA